MKESMRARDVVVAVVFLCLELITDWRPQVR